MYICIFSTNGRVPFGSSTEFIKIGHSQFTIGLIVNNKSKMYYRNSHNVISLQKQLPTTITTTKTLCWRYTTDWYTDRSFHKQTEPLRTQPLSGTCLTDEAVCLYQNSAIKL